MRRSVVWAILAGAVAAGVALLLVFGFVTLRNTNTTVQDVQRSQVNHSATLAHIDSVANRVKALSHQIETEIKSLAMGNATVDQILQEAGATSRQLENDSAVTKADVALICNSLHLACATNS